MPTGFEHRRRARRIDLRVLVGQRVAVEDVDRHAFVRQAELGQQQPNLVAVARSAVVVEAQAVLSGHGWSPSTLYPSSTTPSGKLRVDCSLSASGSAPAGASGRPPPRIMGTTCNHSSASALISRNACMVVGPPTR